MQAEHAPVCLSSCTLRTGSHNSLSSIHVLLPIRHQTTHVCTHKLAKYQLAGKVKHPAGCKLHNTCLANTPPDGSQLTTQKVGVQVLDFGGQDLIPNNHQGSGPGEGCCVGRLGLGRLTGSPCPLHAAVSQHVCRSKAAILFAQETAMQSTGVSAVRVEQCNAWLRGFPETAMQRTAYNTVCSTAVRLQM